MRSTIFGFSFPSVSASASVVADTAPGFASAPFGRFLGAMETSVLVPSRTAAWFAADGSNDTSSRQ